ncbi:hypothetical protein SUGI_0661790 [Cryptomeria japonica]|nr:hypothetical protein SUGI_0661790 [Cryptomeria japonica]
MLWFHQWLPHLERGEMVQAQSTLKSRNGRLLPFGLGILWLTIVLFVETTSWTSALNVRPNKQKESNQTVKNVELYEEHATTPSIFTAFPSG